MKVAFLLLTLGMANFSVAQQTFFNQKIPANQVTANEKIQDALAANYVSTSYAREENFMPTSLFKLKINNDFPVAVEQIKWQTYSNSSLSYIGKITAQPNSSVVLSKYQQRWNGMITTQENKKYIISQTTDDVFAISEVNEQSYQIQDAITDQISPTPEGTTANYNVCDAANPCTANPVTINIMVAYTPAAAAVYGGTANTISNITTAITNMNVANSNSGVTANIVFNLVHAEEVSYVESGDPNTDLIALRSSIDGIMDNVHTLRTTHQADLVSLIVASPTSTCGLGYLNNSATNYNASYAFNVVIANCVVGNFSMAHELGHNMGLNHDWYVSSSINPCEHHHGYVNQAALAAGAPTNKRWRTILAYNNQCSAAGFNCTRINNWSNPDVLRNGDPMGINIGSPNPANEAYGINRFACVVASFFGPAVLPLKFLGLQAQYQQQQLQVQWQTADESNVARYEVEFAENLPQYFTKIAETNAQNLNHNNYALSIGQILPKQAFVKIKAIDFDGGISYSNIVSINNHKAKNDLAYLKTNVVNQYLDLYLNTENNLPVQVNLFSFDGKLISKTILPATPGFLTHQINMGNAGSGFYLVQVTNGETSNNFKVFKQ